MRRRAVALAAIAGAAVSLLAGTTPAGAIPPTPTVALSPTSGAAGSTVTISGSCGVGGLPGPQSVHLVLLDPAGRTAVAGLIADGLAEGAAAVQGRVVLTRRGRLLADAVVRRLLG